MTVIRGEFQELLRILPQTPIYQNLIPLGAMNGWPWPRRGADGALAVTIPFYAVSPPGKTPLSIFPPFATLTVRWGTGNILEYRDLRFDCPWPNVDPRSACDQFPHVGVAHFSSEQWYTALQDAYNLYDHLFAALEANAQLDDERKNRLITHLRLLTPPGLRSFYMRLSPTFFGLFF